MGVACASVCVCVRQKYSPPTYFFMVIIMMILSFLFFPFIFFLFSYSLSALLSSLLARLPSPYVTGRRTMHQTVISFDCSVAVLLIVSSPISLFFFFHSILFLFFFVFFRPSYQIYYFFFLFFWIENELFFEPVPNFIDCVARSMPRSQENAIRYSSYHPVTE